MTTNKVFKLFFQTDEEDEPIVRKLILNSSEITFEKLLSKIQELQDISEESATVQYLDQDGDKVTVATTEELLNALSEQATEPYKFKIKVKRKVLSPLDVNAISEVHHGIICTCCHEIVKGFRYKCVICSNYDICQRCEAKGTHPAHDMLRIAAANRNYPSHFFSRLQRLYEKLNHPQNSHSISSVVSSKSSLLEPMAKDLLDDDANSDLDMDLESYMTAADETLRPESSLPSIEELTKNVQNLIDKDNAADVEVKEEVNKIEEKPLTLLLNEAQEIKEEKVADTKSESFDEKIQEVEKCQEEVHEILEVKEEKGQDKEVVNDHDKTDETNVEIPEKEQNNSIEKVKFECNFGKQDLSESKSRNTLSKLQDEIDKLLAPLTPNAVTPKEDLIVDADEEEDDRMSISSTVSSSPFELCEITEAAIIEHSITPVNDKKSNEHNQPNEATKESNVKTDKSDALIVVADKVDQMNGISSKSDKKADERYANEVKEAASKDVRSEPSEVKIKASENSQAKINNVSVRPKLKIGVSLAKDDLIEVLDTEEIKAPSPKPKVIPKRSESPVSPEEAQALLKIVDDYDRKSQEPAVVPNVDNYMLASSRLMLRKQLRQETVAKNLYSTAASEVLGTRSRTNQYSSDTYDYRPPYVAPSMTSSYSAGDDYTSSRYSTRPNSYHYSSSYNATPSSSASTYGGKSDRNATISDAVGQMRSMGFTDEDGWLTQLCTIKRGNIEQILDVLSPVKK